TGRGRPASSARIAAMSASGMKAPGVTMRDDTPAGRDDARDGQDSATTPFSPHQARNRRHAHRCDASITRGDVTRTPVRVRSRHRLVHLDRHWLRSTGFTLLLVGLVAAAIGADWTATLSSLLTCAVGFGFFYLLFPGGAH